MRTILVVAAIAAALPAAGCGPKSTRPNVPPRPAPPATPAPVLGDAPRPPPCLGEPVPVLEASVRGGALVASAERLFMIGRDPTSIEVAWAWGGTPAVLARGPQDRDVVDLAIDDRYVYWSISAHRDPITGCVVADDGAIYRVPHAGGAVETVVAAAGSPRDLAIAGGHLFWLDEGPCTRDAKIPTPRSIQRRDLATGKTVTVRDDPGLAELVVEGDTLTVLANGEVARSDTSGAGYRVLAAAPGGSNLVVRGGRIFVGLRPDGTRAHVAEIPAAGGAPIRISPLGGIDTIWADADTLYVSGAEIWARPLIGGSLEVVAEDAELVAIAGDRLLAWSGPERQTLLSIPRTQRLHAIVATDLIGATSMASDATALYWADRYGGIWSLPRAGGAAVQLATDTDTGAEHQLALAGDRIVFTSDGMDHHGPGAVGWIPKAGGAVTWLATELGAPLTLAIGGSDVYVGDGGGAIARYAATGGGAPATLAPRSGGRIVAMVADAKRVYFMRAEDYTIYALERTGGAIATLGRTSDEATALLLDDGDLVIATRFDGIFRVATKGGTPRIVARPRDVPGQLVRDRAHLYWATRTGIERVPRGGGAKAQVGPGADGALAVTDDAIYWSSGGSVRRLATPDATRGVMVQALEPETGPLALVGSTAFVGTRGDVRAVDLTTGAVEVIAATHRTPSWVGADATTVYFLMDDRFWAIDRAAAAKHRAEVMAASPRSTDRERGFDTNFIEPLAPAPVTGVHDVELTADALVWTTGDQVMRLRLRGRAVDTLARGLAGATWLAHDATHVYVTAKAGAGWAVFALGAGGAAPTSVTALDAAPRGLAADAGDVVVSTETAVMRVAANAGTPQVIAADQRGAGAVAVAGRAVSWMTRDGIMTSDGTGCGARRLAAWPSGTGPLPGAALAAGAGGVVFTDPSAGAILTAR